MLNPDVVKNEKMIRAVIDKCLRKEIHPNTKPSIDFIYKILDDAYTNSVIYDVTDMRPAIMAFALNSSHQASYCIGLVSKMKFKSDVVNDDIPCDQEAPIVFFDVEVFPNLFIICWKKQGDNQSVIRMINPTPEDVKMLTKYRLIGFNNRNYDNHIIYARMMGYSNIELFNLSCAIVNKGSNAKFREAYNLSYTDVYDFSASTNKKSLKKWEIELGIKHHELGLPWDQPVPEELWTTVAEYCDDDVYATEAVFEYLKADWMTREILAKLAKGTVNDSTNSLCAKIVFGDDKHPQSKFIHPDLSELFPGYVFKNGKSTYMGVETGEGGYVYANPGCYGNVALLDIASMHPTSAECMNMFGPYTKRYSNIKKGRIAIKHKDYEEAARLLDYPIEELKACDNKALANGLKTVVNSAAGMSCASFDNPFRDPNNVDNIMQKRGALFMVTLKNEVEKRGFIVAHIKTDSIKIPDATKEIVDFVMDFGKRYGYTFEHEATYDKMCLVNNAVYIARKAKPEKCMTLYGYVPDENMPDEHNEVFKWTATGAQFAQPYLFKTLFSHENIEFEDLCETKSATTSLYLDLNETLPDVTCQEKELLKLQKKDPQSERIPELISEVAKGHAYKFIGKVGQFCPVVSGVGGGILVRENKGTYASVSGTKGYRFMETEKVKTLKLEESIDISYYRKFVDDAIDDISQYCNFDWFVSEVEYDKENNQIIPF